MGKHKKPVCTYPLKREVYGIGVYDWRVMVGKFTRK